ncbi:MAG: hypothetical protein SFY80_15325 [Verrucomicrobiota bacterium]|nr:hypothetical protein [Verrucomicrobiota bacterium]
MEQHATVGLLPLYLALYDEKLPTLRTELLPLLERVQSGLEAEGIVVLPGAIARTADEVKAVVARFLETGVDAIATLHLAYSPSLEAISVLKEAGRPLVLLDTSLDSAFGLGTNPLRLLQNHGVHGVQDLASVLRRESVAYKVVAGDSASANFYKRSAEAIRGARAARLLQGMRVLRVGTEFPGMGDFRVSPALLQHKWGIQVDEIAPAALLPAAVAITEDAIQIELSTDIAQYNCEISETVHRRSLKVDLALRSYLETGHYGAFSVNFLNFTENTGPLCTVPFLECSKAMARGLGYAGEGDILTAALVGALNGGFSEAGFTELFCADWAGESLFFSHMAESNPALSAVRPRLCEKDFPFTGALNPAMLACAPRPGPATLINLAPGPENTFSLITAEVDILEDGTHPDIINWVRAWMRPKQSVPAFLEAYSDAGGTHHSAILPGHRTEALAWFARLSGMQHVVI